MNKLNSALLIFILVSILDIIGILFRIPILVQIFKPFILLSLIALYSLSVSEKNKVYIFALVFSFFGDVFLMFEGEQFFIIGLVSFLIAHILFIKIVIERIRNLSISKIAFASIPFLLIFGLIIYTLKDTLNEMLIPVMVYGLTIATFGTVSMIQFSISKSKRDLLMLNGAVVFMISDSVLAINKFLEPQHIFEVLVMVTYVLSQYLIYRSMAIDKD